MWHSLVEPLRVYRGSTIALQSTSDVISDHNEWSHSYVKKKQIKINETKQSRSSLGIKQRKMIYNNNHKRWMWYNAVVMGDEKHDQLRQYDCWAEYFLYSQWSQ